MFSIRKFSRYIAIIVFYLLSFGQTDFAYASSKDAKTQLITKISRSPHVPSLEKKNNSRTSGRAIAAAGSKTASDGLVQVSHNYNTAGHLISEILTAADYTEFTTDPRGTGSHDIWEISKPSLGIKFRAMEPVNGHFQTLEIVKQRDGGRYFLRYSYDKRRKVFALASVTFKEDWPMFAAILDQRDASGKFKMTCAEGDQVYQQVNNWLDIMKKISAGDQSKGEKLLACYLKRYRDAFFDEKCYTGAFKDSFDDLQKGIVKVMSSSLPAEGKPVYLQCLIEQGFSTHTARIESQYSNLSRSLQAAIFNDKEMSDAKGDINKVLALCDKPFPIGELAGRSNSPIDCVLDNTSGEMAQYKSATGGRDQIIFHRTSDNIASNPTLASDFNLPSRPVSDVYASYFFHESLHQSEIENETIVYGLQNCCDGRPGEHTGDCSKAQKYAAITDLPQQYEDVFNSAFTDFGNTRGAIIEAFGANTSLQNAMMDSFYAGFDSHKETANSQYVSCTTPISPAKCDENCKNECSKTYLNEMAKFTQEWFNDANYCPLFRSKADEPSNIDCAQIGAAIAQKMKAIGESKVAGQAEKARNQIQNLTNPRPLGEAALVPGVGQVQTITAGANDVSPPNGSIPGAITQRPPSAVIPGEAPKTSSPPSVKLGQSGPRPDAASSSVVGPVTGRVKDGNQVATGINNIAESVLPKARAESPDDREGGRTSSNRSPVRLADKARAMAFNSELASLPSNSANTLNLTTGPTGNFSNVSGRALASSSPSLVAAAVDAQAANGNRHPRAAPTSGATTPAGSDADEKSVDTSGGSRRAGRNAGGREQVQNSGVKNQPRHPLGSSAPGAQTLAGSGSTGARGGPANRPGGHLDFSSSEKVQQVLLGNYEKVRGYLHGRDEVSSEFNESLKQYSIFVSEKKGGGPAFTFGPKDGKTRFEYCPQSKSFIFEGMCK